MSNPSFDIKNPSVTLYAFHLCQDLTREPGQLRTDAGDLWQRIADLNQPLRTPELHTLPAQLDRTRMQHLPRGRFVNLLSSAVALRFPTADLVSGVTAEVTVYPVQLHDTYALDLTLSCQDATLTTHHWHQFNPHGCLLPDQIRASLGQTILLYAEPLNPPEQDRDVANACVHSFLAESQLEATPSRRPVLVTQSLVFGSPLFEYDTGQDKPIERCHILVWLNRHPQTVKLASRTSLPWLNLLCCRSKICFAYAEADWCYYQTRTLYVDLETQAQALQHLSTQSEEGLRQLKQQLSQLPTQTFEYARYLRNIRDYQTAIATNVKNYRYWWETIAQASLDGDQLTVGDTFLHSTCPHYQEQLQTDLSYLAAGHELFAQMLIAIQSIVEVEQAETDRTLQLWLAFIGISLAVSGVSSQAKPQLGSELINYLHPTTPPLCQEKVNFPPWVLCTTADISSHILLGLIVGLISAKPLLQFTIPLIQTIARLLPPIFHFGPDR